MPFQEIITIKPDDVKTRLFVHFHTKNEELDETMDDMTNENLVTQPIETKTLFKHEEQKNNEIESLYDRIHGYHEDNDVDKNDIAENFLTILGLLSDTDIENLNHTTTRDFIRICYSYNETEMTEAQIMKLKIGFCRQFLKEEQDQILQMPVEKRFLPLKLENVRQHCVRLLSRSQIQILLLSTL